MMKRFEKRELRQALAWSAQGNIALHLHNVIADWRRAPRIFRDALRHGELIAHLFDQDLKRLKSLAREFGVLKIHVGRKGQPGQHIDLCGGPLIRAEIYCDDPEEYHVRFDTCQEERP